MTIVWLVISGSCMDGDREEHGIYSTEDRANDAAAALEANRSFLAVLPFE